MSRFWYNERSNRKFKQDFIPHLWHWGYCNSTHLWPKYAVSWSVSLNTYFHLISISNWKVLLAMAGIFWRMIALILLMLAHVVSYYGGQNFVVTTSLEFEWGKSRFHRICIIIAKWSTNWDSISSAADAGFSLNVWKHRVDHTLFCNLLMLV